jgi:CBS domain-containing protein
MNALESPVDTLMTPDPVIVAPEDAVDVAETVMRLGRANEWPVADGRALLGVVTIGDLLQERGDGIDGERKCAGVMTTPAIVAHPSDSLAHAARCLHDHRLSCLPIVSGGELVGLITLTDFVDLAVAQLERAALRYGNAAIVAHLMTSTPTTVRPDNTLATAQMLMETMRVRHLPVLPGNRQLAGIVAQRDLVWALRVTARPASRVAVREIMTTSPKTTAPEHDAASAGRMLVHHGIGALPVMRGDRLIGILTKRDFLRHLVSLAPAAATEEWS